MKTIIREMQSINGKFDNWGSCMGLMFTLCQGMSYLGYEIPNKWGYSSPYNYGNKPDKEEDYLYYYLELWRYSEKNLIKLGELLYKYTNYLDHCGESY